VVRGGHAESGRLRVPETWFNLSEDSAKELVRSLCFLIESWSEMSLAACCWVVASKKFLVVEIVLRSFEIGMLILIVILSISLSERAVVISLLVLS
jgi:hypothetical protein